MSLDEGWVVMQEMAPKVQRPPRLAVHPELRPEDVDWLNAQLALTDNPPVRYARELPVPPAARARAAEQWPLWAAVENVEMQVKREKARRQDEAIVAALIGEQLR